MGYKTATTMWTEISILSTIQCICKCLWASSLSGDVLESLLEALDCHNSPCVAEPLVPVVFSHNKHRYIPLLSAGGLIHKAQAIPQDLPQELTNLVSYVFATSITKQLIALFFKFKAPVKPTLFFFIFLRGVRIDSQTSLCLFHCWPERECLWGECSRCPGSRCHSGGYSQAGNLLCPPRSGSSGSSLR